MKNRKSVIKFWFVLVISGLIGGITGLLGNMFHLSLENTIFAVKYGLLVSSPYILIAIGIISIGLSLVYYIKAKRLYTNYNEDDDLAFDKIDKLAGIAISILGISNILNMIWCGFILLGIQQNYFSLLLFAISLIMFVSSGVISAFMQRRYIEFTKKLYPEKKGDVLDLNFQKDWLASLDEQEQQAAHKAAFKVYSASPILFCSLFLILLLGSTLFDIGILPFIVLGIVWLTQSIIYFKECI